MHYGEKKQMFKKKAKYKRGKILKTNTRRYVLIYYHEYIHAYIHDIFDHVVHFPNE